ncbi:amidohydrolase family protein [Nocardioides cheoyonin]|uniref:amidohydrolase family protein n=1 Tax=Nocardioides cheoyonin TaxID=3156615 RepID=UPI0032B54597
MIVDSHLHVWDLGSGGYRWLGPQHGPLHRTFTADEAARELTTAGVDRAVLVQADDTEADTRAMLAAADAHTFVAGVVGWVRLDDPATAERQLDDYGTHPRFCGVRHLVHDDPRDDFLKLPGVRRSLGLLAERGLPLDVPDAWPRHLHRLPALADAVPGLTLVLDHLGKPPRGTDELDAWAAAVRDLAARPNVVAKVSGLQRSGQPFSVEALRPVWELALEAFGPDRLMYGGDWPMTVHDGGYAPHWRVVRRLVDELGTDEQAAILGGTATRSYGLPKRIDV